MDHSRKMYNNAVINIIRKDPLKVYDVFMQEIGELKCELKPRDKMPNDGLINFLKQISCETEALLAKLPCETQLVLKKH